MHEPARAGRWRDNLIMSTLGSTIAVKGEVRASEDIIVEGRIDGPISCENGSVVISPSAHVTGTIIARDITVFGRTAGHLVATEVVDVRPDATVTGQVTSKRFILDAAAYFKGRVSPQQLDAALSIARYKQRNGEQ